MSKSYLGTGLRSDRALYHPAQTLFSFTGNGRKWATALGASQVFAWPPAKILLVGDSTNVAYGYYVERFRRRLMPFNGGRLSVGWVQGDADASSIYPYKFTLTTGSTGATEGDNNFLDTNYGPSGQSYRLASGSVLTLRTGANATVSPRMSRIEVFYTKKKAAGSAILEVRIDGTLQASGIQTTDAAITPAFQSGFSTAYDLTPGNHTVTITGAGGNAAILDGVYISDGTSSSVGDRVMVIDAGHPTWKYSHFLAANNVGPGQFMANWSPDLVISTLGINDYSDGVSTYAANMSTWVSETRTAAPDVTLGIAIPYAINTRTDWADFVLAAKQTAMSLDIPVLDNSVMIQTNASTTDPNDVVTDTDGSTPHTHLTSGGAEYYAVRLAQFCGLPVVDPTQVTVPVEFCVAVGDETTTLTTTGNPKVTFRAPYAFRLRDLRASVNTVSSSGTPTFDVNVGGSSIISTKLTIDASEKTSTTAATPFVFSSVDIADDAEITIDIDVAGTGAKGAKVWFYGYRFP